MKTEINTFIAFILNVFFSAFELAGGIYTGSVAILSDSIHDIGDATGIGISLFLEKKSKKTADNVYTYGYGRFSVVGSLITNTILICSSLTVIFSSVKRIVYPTQIQYDGMIVLAVVGVCVNLLASVLTHEKGSLNRKAVNLHMLEDTLGWAAVLAGAVVMKFTDFRLIDPLLSLGISVFIMVKAWRNTKEALYIFLEKVPSGIDISEIQKNILNIADIIDVHHIHIHTIDENCIGATMHIVTKEETTEHLKVRIREELSKSGISHVTLEFEKEHEVCHDRVCGTGQRAVSNHHH